MFVFSLLWDSLEWAVVGATCEELLTETPKHIAEDSPIPSLQLTSGLNANTKITSSLFNGNNYKDWVYSVEMVVGGLKQFGYIDGSVKEPKDGDPKSVNWVAENKLIMTWILNSMEASTATSFTYWKSAKEL